VHSDFVVQVLHQIAWHLPDSSDHPRDADGSDLFDLGFAVLVQAAAFERYKNLKRVDAVGVAGQWHDHDGGGFHIGGVSGHDHGGSDALGFVAAYRVEVDEEDIATSNQVHKPSAVVFSQSLASSLPSHSSLAAR
jgi:hypothetical protein